SPRSRAYIAPDSPDTSEPPEVSRCRGNRSSRSRAMIAASTTATAPTAATTVAITSEASPTSRGLNQPAAIETTSNNAANVTKENSAPSQRTSGLSPRLCWAAANATAPPPANPAATAQAMMAAGDEPDRAETRAPSAVPTRAETATTAYNRRASRRPRRTGASISQKPSAAEARTGPNNRLIPSATATANATEAHGSTVRADRQVGSLHCETDTWA